MLNALVIIKAYNRTKNGGKYSRNDWNNSQRMDKVGTQIKDMGPNTVERAITETERLKPSPCFRGWWA